MNLDHAPAKVRHFPPNTESSLSQNWYPLSLAFRQIQGHIKKKSIYLIEYFFSLKFGRKWTSILGVSKYELPPFSFGKIGMSPENLTPPSNVFCVVPCVCLGEDEQDMSQHGKVTMPTSDSLYLVYHQDNTTLYLLLHLHRQCCSFSFPIFKLKKGKRLLVWLGYQYMQRLHLDVKPH